MDAYISKCICVKKHSRSFLVVYGYLCDTISALRSFASLHVLYSYFIFLYPTIENEEEEKKRRQSNCLLHMHIYIDEKFFFVYR